MTSLPSFAVDRCRRRRRQYGVVALAAVGEGGAAVTDMDRVVAIVAIEVVG